MQRSEMAEEVVRVETLKSPAEGRVLLRNVSWETYERLIAEREESPVPRFYYDRGVLEIVSPSTEHEEIGDIMTSLVKEVAVELEIDVFAAGSTTFRRTDVGRGFEPDGSFYLRDAAGRVRAERRRGKRTIDLDAGDPPPDLVVEADLTSSSLDKLPIYAKAGVPEVWRYAGGQPEILGLQGEGYEQMTRSRALPSLTSEDLARLLQGGLTRARPDWVREVRQWVRSRQE